MTTTLTASGVSFEFLNGRSLFSQLNFSLSNWRYALVGPNGVGKTTLAKILAGELEPSSGRIHRAGSFAYFQQREIASAQTVENFLGPLSAWSEMEDRLLQGIDFSSICTQLSGGQWMKVRLAKLLRAQPDFLVLDEPTNDLDREGRLAVHDLIKNFASGILLISHDRETLNFCDEVLELSNLGLAKFGGGWKSYVAEKSREHTSLVDHLEDSKRARETVRADRHHQMQKQEKRNRKGVLAAEKGGLPKILLGARKRRAQVTTGRVDSETLAAADEAVTTAHDAFSKLKIDPVMYPDLIEVFVPAQKLVAEANDFNARYAFSDRDVFKANLNFAWRGPVRVAIRGANGSGKSTLIRLMVESANGAKNSSAGFQLSGNL